MTTIQSPGAFLANYGRDATKKYPLSNASIDYNFQVIDAKLWELKTLCWFFSENKTFMGVGGQDFRERQVEK